tara:strand:+ start:189 stop:524 length:336 start_codon:yes stop_codon:yes gene_type:complete
MDTTITCEGKDKGLSVSCYVDNRGDVIVYLDNLTLRTDYKGAVELSECLDQAAQKLQNLGWGEEVGDSEGDEQVVTHVVTDIPALGRKHASRGPSETQRVDIWNPNDPSNW